MMSENDFGQLGLQIVPRHKRTRGRGGETIGLIPYGKGCRLNLSKTLRETRHFKPGVYVEVLIGKGVIAVRTCEAHEPNARLLGTGGDVAFPEALALFEIKIGDRYRMPIEWAHGHAIARLPAELKLQKGGR